MTIREYLQQRVLLFDGATGTYLAAEGPCEELCLTDPGRVVTAHRAYLEAGARAIKTNTFAANVCTYGGDFAHVRAVIEAAWRIASEAAAPYEAYVFADMGPMDSSCDRVAEYCKMAEVFLACGATQFLFETMPDGQPLAEVAAYIRARCPQAYILTSFAVGPDGFTQAGIPAQQLLREMAACGNVDAAGFNCISGPAHLRHLAESADPCGLTLSVMPNAGYPTVLGSRPVYGAGPEYFAGQLRETVLAGAGIVGGCCGTTPALIAAAAQAVHELSPPAVRGARPVQMQTPQAGSALLERLNRGERILAVELDPPEDSDGRAYLACARALRRSGADVLTIADCPVARTRMDSSLLACKLHRELGMEVLPHMTCRDRNLNATKALLLGLSMEGIENVLVVTGDPIPSARRDEVKSVYNFNSRMLMRYISGLGAGVLQRPMTLCGALNVNARSFARVQLQLAREKIECGAKIFLTQPVFTDEAVEHLALAKKTLDAKLLGGIMPIVSYRNACFLRSEIAGISIDDATVARYEGLSREASADLAVELAVQTARRIAPYVDGFYLITPFRRVDIIGRIITAIRQEGL